jgi:hypothetical protein
VTDPGFLLYGLALGLVWFLGINAAATLLVLAVARRLARQDRIRNPRFWLMLRLLPAAASIGLVAAVFLPGYWVYEPRAYAEEFNLTLGAAAAVALGIVVAAIARGAAAWIRAARRARAWGQKAQPLTLPEGAIPAFEIDEAAPIVALVGLLRPRLFVARSVVGALTSEELAAGLGHELGHWRARDNLTRLAMRAAPDLLATTAVARDLERRWASAAEHRADRHASEMDHVDDRARARCALASAIVKVARMAPPMTTRAEPISSLVDDGDIALRVRTLLDDAAPAATAARSCPPSIAMALAVAALAAVYVPLLRVVYALTEIVVQTLP